MRVAILLVVLTLGLFTVAPAMASDVNTAANGATALSASAAQQPAKDINVDINVNKGGGHVWYASPVWLAIGGLALVIVILLVVMAARGGGGGTTIVRE